MIKGSKTRLINACFLLSMSSCRQKLDIQIHNSVLLLQFSFALPRVNSCIHFFTTFWITPHIFLHTRHGISLSQLLNSIISFLSTPLVQMLISCWRNSIIIYRYFTRALVSISLYEEFELFHFTTHYELLIVRAERELVRDLFVDCEPSSFLAINWVRAVRTEMV
jgi:hypothetical protein